MIEIPKIELRPYLDMAWRRKWWIVVPLLLTLIAGAAYLDRSPRVYRASTMVLVEAQRVPSDFVPSTVTDDLQSRMRTITQQINSRTNLEEIIREHEVYPVREESGIGLLEQLKSVFSREDSSEVDSLNTDNRSQPSMESMVENVRRRIDIELQARDQAFVISFQWSDPQTASRVANALASQFIDQNLKVRGSMATATSRFLAMETQRLQQQLQQREAALEEFRHQNMGSLPSQLQSNINILAQQKEELGRVEEQAHQVRNEIQLLRRMLAQAQQEREAQELETGVEAEIRTLQARLEEARSRYTSQHPEVRALNNRMEQLYQERERLAMHSEQEIREEITGTDSDLRMELERLQARLEGHERRMQNLESQIRIYEERVERTSEVDLELTNLERDYEAVNERYQTLLRRQLDAEMAEQMELSQQGERFRVVDPAVPPSSPFSPDVNRIMFMAMALGLGMGGGLAYLRESLDSAFYTSTEVDKVLQPGRIISIPTVEREGKGGKKFLGRDKL